MSEALQALYAGDLDEALKLLPPDDQVSMHEAAGFGRVEALKAILAADPSQAAALSDGFTPLHLAVFAQQPDAAQALIDGGADVNVRSSGAIARVPPLGTAAFVGSVALSRLLLDAGADVDGQGEGGFTALHTAAARGNLELIRLLLEHGADLEIVNAEGRRPRDLAKDPAALDLL